MAKWNKKRPSKKNRASYLKGGHCRARRGPSQPRNLVRCMTPDEEREAARRRRTAEPSEETRQRKIGLAEALWR